MNVSLPTTKAEANLYAEQLRRTMCSALVASVKRVFKFNGKWCVEYVLSWTDSKGMNLIEMVVGMEIADLITVSDAIFAMLGVPDRRIN